MIMVEEWWKFVLKRELYESNMYFEHMSLHKYTRVARNHDRVAKEHNRSGAGEEGFAALCAGCERTPSTRPL